MDTQGVEFAKEQVTAVRAAATELVDSLLRMVEQGQPREALVNRAQMALIAESGRMLRAAIVSTR